MCHVGMDRVPRSVTAVTFRLVASLVKKVQVTGSTKTEKWYVGDNRFRETGTELVMTLKHIQATLYLILPQIGCQRSFF